jgi:hypothetical protein
MNARSEHPVWQVYDQFRTARLNVRYYSARAVHLRRTIQAFDMFLAICAPTSAIAGFYVWQSEIGAPIWQFLAGLAAVIAVIRPFLHLTERLESVEQALTGYRALDSDLEQLAVLIEQKGDYDKESHKRLQRALKRKEAIIGRLTRTEPEDKKLKKECTEIVNRELPPGSFFVPE